MRYAACVNNPGWRTWIDAVARLVAAVGYDGAFIDNGGTQQCYCRFCQANLTDLKAQRSEQPDAVQTRRRRYFQSSAGYLRHEE